MTSEAAPGEFGHWAHAEHDTCLTQDEAEAQKLFECRVFNHTGQLAVVLSKYVSCSEGYFGTPKILNYVILSLVLILMFFSILYLLS